MSLESSSGEKNSIDEAPFSLRHRLHPSAITPSSPATHRALAPPHQFGSAHTLVAAPATPSFPQAPLVSGSAILKCQSASKAPRRRRAGCRIRHRRLALLSIELGSTSGHRFLLALLNPADADARAVEVQRWMALRALQTAAQRLFAARRDGSL